MLCHDCVGQEFSRDLSWQFLCSTWWESVAAWAQLLHSASSHRVWTAQGVFSYVLPGFSIWLSLSTCLLMAWWAQGNWTSYLVAGFLAQESRAANRRRPSFGSHTYHSATFYWSEQITGPVQIQGEKNRLHFSKAGVVREFAAIFQPPLSHS